MGEISEKNTPLLTAVVPISNMAGKLDILHSWLSQTYKYPMEVILVHDFKDLATGAELSLMLDTICNSQIKLFTVEFGSPGLSRNFGLSKAGGSWIVFWDSDDLPNVNVVLQMLLSEKLHRTSQGQSTFSIIARVAVTRSASPTRFTRGPSATTNNFGGRAFAISLKTFAVVSGRLNIINATGVVNVKLVI